MIAFVAQTEHDLIRRQRPRGKPRGRWFLETYQLRHVCLNRSVKKCADFPALDSAFFQGTMSGVRDVLVHK